MWIKKSNPITSQTDPEGSRRLRFTLFIQQLKAKHEQIVLQWIPGHSQIAGNEYADTLAKKSAKITQTYIRETSYHSIKLHLKTSVAKCVQTRIRDKAI